MGINSSRAQSGSQPGGWLLAGRVVWLILAAMAIILWLAGSVESATVIPADCAENACDPIALSAGDLEALAELNLPVDLIAHLFAGSNFALAVAYFVIGGAIAWRKSADWMGLLVSFALIYIGAIFFTDSNDALWRAYPASRAHLNLLGLAGFVAITFLLFSFPDGQIVPRGKFWRFPYWLIVLVAAPVVALANLVVEMATLLTAALIVLGLASQVYRYRQVSGPLQRQQTKWILFGLATTLVAMLIWMSIAVLLPPGRMLAETELGPDAQLGFARVIFLLLARPLVGILITLLPLSFAISILRYRLWDVEVVINRTLVYGLLTAVLAGIYFGTVVILQSLLTAVSGQESPVAVVISTLFIAIFFRPLRRRVQSFIDRRFYRRKYDAHKTLAAFAATTRDEADLERLTAELLRVVETTMQPESLSLLWIRNDKVK